jgi:tetratricopeptide (TPR) repeat protein
MANRNLFGSAQAFVLPFILLVLYKASKTWKYLSAIAVAGIIISVFVSQTRSAWLAAAGIFIISLILVLLFSQSNRKKWLLNSLISIPIIALLIGLVIISDKENKFTESIKQRAHSLVEVSTKVSTTAEEGGNERLKMWLLTSRLIRDHTLLGVGPGNWKIEIPKYDTAGLIWPNGKFVPTRPHNDYLQVTSETGIPGILLYLSMWVLISVIAFKIILRPRTEGQRIIVILMLSGIGGFAIDSIFSFPTERIEHSLFIYIMAGIIIGNFLQIDETAKQKRLVLSKIFVTVFLLIIAVNILIGYKKYNFEMHMNYAKAYENNKNYEEELDEAETGKTNFVTISPEGMPLEVRSSIAYKELKDYKNALKEILQAKSYNPNSAMIYNNMGTIYTEIKDFNNAIKSYQQALKLSPKSDIALKNLAVNYFNTENYSACIQTLYKIEEREQDSAYLNNLLNEAKKRLALQSK